VVQLMLGDFDFHLRAFVTWTTTRSCCGRSSS
jgi:hypothetical protein